jgi:hypothetical protein
MPVISDENDEGLAMRRLMLTASVSALLLLAFDQPVQSAPVSNSVSAPPTLGTANAPVENSLTQTAALSISQIPSNVIPATWNDGRPIVVVQHDMPPNIDLKARPRIASDLAVALREPSFAIFATAITFLLGMALFVLRWNLP